MNDFYTGKSIVITGASSGIGALDPGYVRTNISRNAIDGDGVVGAALNKRLESGASPDKLGSRGRTWGGDRK